jgi:8-oxo-dGTP pyrophosphatase MutT (NUDIX family)
MGVSSYKVKWLLTVSLHEFLCLAHGGKREMSPILDLRQLTPSSFLHNVPMSTPYPERWKPSVTVAAIIERAGQFLLVEEHTADGLRLNNPAGHLDPGESPQAGCVREALEETARHFTPTALVGIYLSRFQRPGEDITYLRFAFCGAVGEAIAGRALDTGIVRTVWLHPDEIRASTARQRSPLVLRCIEDYLRGQRYPLDTVFTDSSVLL